LVCANDGADARAGEIAAVAARLGFLTACRRLLAAPKIKAVQQLAVKAAASGIALAMASGTPTTPTIPADMLANSSEDPFLFAL
jgi:hypothetical protein